MAEVVWSPRAIENIQSIKDYIARSSPRYGHLVAQQIVEAVERLGAFPESGRIVPEFSDPQLREILWRDYRIVYRFGGTQIQIVTVFHGSQLFPRPNA